MSSKEGELNLSLKEEEGKTSHFVHKDSTRIVSVLC